jgi:DNA-directed RNA polymerase subunit H (RpoH/RPB5)
MQDHTDDGPACLAHAIRNAHRMLDVRKIPGADVEVTIPCTEIIWSSTRGDSTLLTFVTDVHKKSLGAIQEYAEEHAIPRVIVIYQHKCTPMAAKDMQVTGFECFKMRELVVFPLDSHLVPEYTLLSDEEAVEVRQKYDATRLPAIYTTDRVQRIFAGKINDIYRIVARFGALQSETKYRVVREPST